MAVDADDLIIRYSMGDGSASGAFDFANNKSVGGNISTTELRQGPPPSNLNNNLFDVVKGSESAATRAADYVDYRVIYAYNDAGTTAFDYSVYIPVDGANKPLNYWGDGPVHRVHDGVVPRGGSRQRSGVNATAGVLGGTTTPDETAAPHLRDNVGAAHGGDAAPARGHPGLPVQGDIRPADRPQGSGGVGPGRVRLDDHGRFGAVTWPSPSGRVGSSP